MHLLNQTVLGIAILLLLAILVTAKRIGTGSVLDKPTGNFLVQLVNIFNLFFLLVVNPLVAILLITGHLPAIDPTYIPISESVIVTVLEILGLLVYVVGYLLMDWALILLGRNYQLGGSLPRSGDKMVTEGPYRLVRHPMYTSALSISLGLTSMIHSWAFLGVFCIYLLLILAIVPVEEGGLQKAYGEQYVAYKQIARKLIPFVY